MDSDKDVDGKKWKIRADLICDRDMADKDLEFTSTTITGGDTITAVGTSRRACPIISLSYLYNKYPWAFGIGFIIFGCIFVFVGLKFYKVLLFLLAAFIVTFLLFTIIYQMIILKFSRTKPMIFWVVLGICGLVGLTVGYFAGKYNKYCFVLAGASLGGIGGFMVYSVILADKVDNVFFVFLIINFSGWFM